VHSALAAASGFLLRPVPRVVVLLSRAAYRLEHSKADFRKDFSGKRGARPSRYSTRNHVTNPDYKKSLKSKKVRLEPISAPAITSQVECTPAATLL
jgi:hypothetical protein